MDIWYLIQFQVLIVDTQKNKGTFTLGPFSAKSVALTGDNSKSSWLKGLFKTTGPKEKYPNNIFNKFLNIFSNYICIGLFK